MSHTDVISVDGQHWGKRSIKPGFCVRIPKLFSNEKSRFKKKPSAMHLFTATEVSHMHISLPTEPLKKGGSMLLLRVQFCQRLICFFDIVILASKLILITKLFYVLV